MLLELEKRRGPRALLLRRPPRHATPRHDAPRVAGLSRAELTPTRLFLPVTNGEFLTTGPQSETSDHGLSRTRMWVEPTSLHAAAPISIRCLLTLAATNRSHLLHAHAHRRSVAAAAAGDSIPSAAYTVDGRAGLRNHALLVPVWGEGRIGFWAAITRLLASDRLLPLRPRRLRHHHVHRRRPCRRRES